MPKRTEEEKKPVVYDQFVTITGILTYTDDWSIPDVARVLRAPRVTDPGIVYLTMKDQTLIGLSRSGLNVNIPKVLLDEIWDALESIGMVILDYREFELTGDGTKIDSYDISEFSFIQTIVANSPFLTVRYPDLLTNVMPKSEAIPKKRGRPRKLPLNPV